MCATAGCHCGTCPGGHGTCGITVFSCELGSSARKEIPWQFLDPTAPREQISVDENGTNVRKYSMWRWLNLRLSLQAGRKRTGPLISGRARVLGTNSNFIILQLRPGDITQIPIRSAVVHFKFVPACDRRGLGQTGTVVIDADIDANGKLSASKGAATGRGKDMFEGIGGSTPSEPKYEIAVPCLDCEVSRQVYETLKAGKSPESWLCRQPLRYRSLACWKTIEGPQTTNPRLLG